MSIAVRSFAFLICLGTLFFNGAYTDASMEPEVPMEVARKFKRDASRLALRIQAHDEDLRYLPIQITPGSADKIYKALCQVYAQTDQGKSLAKCNIHTFPNPSIDHMVLIYQKSVEWAAPLQKGLMQTSDRRFNELLTKYKLILEKHVQWTESQNAITLRAKEPLNMAALANEFAQIEGIADIDLGIPKSQGNDILATRAKDSYDLEYVLRFGSAGKFDQHSWKFHVLDSGTVTSKGETGSSLPTWLKCLVYPSVANVGIKL